MEVRILGPLEVCDGLRALPVPGGRSRVVLAVLALNANKIVTQDRLVEAAWGDSEPATARTQVQGMVSALRRILTAGAWPGLGGGVAWIGTEVRTGTGTGTRAGLRSGVASKTGAPRPEVVAITTHGPGYRLELEPDHLDLYRFLRLVERARAVRASGNRRAAAQTLRTALDIWRGSAFEGLNSDFLATERGFLDEARLAALEAYADDQMELGAHTELLDELARAVDANPLHEGMAGRLMLALYRSGRQADALAVYQANRRRLIDELGIEPGDNLQLLQRRILAGDPAPSVLDPVAAATATVANGTSSPAPAHDAVPAQLPPGTPDFTGRAAEVRELQRFLYAGRRGSEYGYAAAVAVITGMGGIGKTALALHVSHRLRSFFTDGQLYLDLGGTSSAPLSVDEALSRLLVDLGVARDAVPENIGARSALYRSMVADRKILIVLDDAVGTASVRPLLPGTSSCAVLVTSRNRLAGLAGVRRLEPGPLTEQEARELFGAIAGPGRLDQDPQALGDTLSACAGLPLAVRVAGTRLAMRPDWTPRDLAHRLGAADRILDELVADDLAVRTSFDASYTALAGSETEFDKESARAFRLLGLWNGPDIGVGAAAAFLGRSHGEVEARLERLVDMHLLAAGSGRYRVHELLRAYGREVAARDMPTAARQAAVARVAHWYIAAMQEVIAAFTHSQAPDALAAGIPVFEGSEAALRWCEAEWRNVIAAAQAARDYNLEDLAQRLWKSARAMTASRQASGLAVAPRIG